jgi:hypothetical protein
VSSVVSQRNEWARRINRNKASLVWCCGPQYENGCAAHARRTKKDRATKLHIKRESTLPCLLAN